MMRRRRLNSALEGFFEGVDYKDIITRYRANVLHESVKRILNVSVDKTFLVDTFHSFYLPVPFLKKEDEIPEPKRLLYKIINETLNSPIVHENRKFTILNTNYGMLYTVAYIKSLVESLRKRYESTTDSKEKETLSQILDQMSTSSLENQQDANQKKEGTCSIEQQKGRNGSQQNQQQEEQLEKLIEEINKDALIKAEEKVKTAMQLENMMNGGQSAGMGSSLLHDENIDNVLELAENTEIKKILELLSGLTGLGTFTKKRYTEFQRGEVHGYKIGSFDDERIVPSELALPDDLFYAKLAESELLLQERKIREAKGAIYVLLDKSGSMEENEKKIWAKAVALALYNRARKEKRDYYIRFFDGTPYQLYKVSKKSKANDVMNMLRYIASIRASGGTNISRAIITACEDIKDGHVKGTSEIILITDGEDEIDSYKIKRVLKEVNAKLFTVMIKGNNENLSRISEEYFIAKKVDQGDLLSVIKY